ncbi:serine/threonine protein kinase [Streptomyces boluensis]|uniref:Serine/threonine protein kinase n=1 Tax=Streptomyces boluensis TaxID=1775135 RepID=A0A964UXW4_9ACTN|nr:serine/threonine protein kinase [Streptomyces boluensis]NBE54857.1 serine/threonine protein kinase [Streptomyces boluensis]
MEHLRPDDPEQIGPYTVLARLDPTDGPRPSGELRYVARTPDGLRTVLAVVPRPGTDPVRWAIEAEGARRLSLPEPPPGLAPVTETGGTANAPWYAHPYLPVLPLPEALARYGGPLPEPVVRALGAALATTLATVHAEGFTHAGLSATAVLLGAEGPLLTSYGAVRTAAPDGEQRIDVPGLDPGCVAPEQAQGGRPRPSGDVFALGAVLAYAACGHTVPEREELPAGLRSLITACLSRDPAKRPAVDEVRQTLAGRAPVATLVDGASGTATADALTLAFGSPGVSADTTTLPFGTAATPADTATVGFGLAAAGPHGDVGDGSYPSTGAGPFPLPAGLVEALVRDAAALLATELPVPTSALD